jgi:hypothetical protein
VLEEYGFEPAAIRSSVAMLFLVGMMLTTSVLAEGAGKPETKPANSNKVEESRPPAVTAAPKTSTPARSTLATGPARRVALSTTETRSHTTLKPDLSAGSKRAASPTATPAEEDPVARALRTIRECETRFSAVADYSCTFYKRERINGQMSPQFVMSMKARTTPRSIYFKFEDPNKGREAIYVEGRNDGKILAHDVGFTKFLAGTMELKPTSARAMENNRHPITDAGIGALIDTVKSRWAVELSPEESLIVFDSDLTIGPRRCLMIESIHPHRQAEFHFHKVRLFIDNEHFLPIRFEGYDWPKDEGGPAELVEEYSYIDLKLNIGLDDRDFDPANPHYSFGRF